MTKFIIVNIGESKFLESLVLFEDCKVVIIIVTCS